MSEQQKFMRLVGPVRFDPDEDGLAGMGWLVPYLDSNRAGGRLRWCVHSRLPSRDHAVELREQLLATEGAERMDDMDVFMVCCRMAQCAAQSARKRQARRDGIEVGKEGVLKGLHRHHFLTAFRTVTRCVVADKGEDDVDPVVVILERLSERSYPETVELMMNPADAEDMALSILQMLEDGE